MIPQNIKSAIDKFRSRIPTDEELTALFDLVNSAKLKIQQQEEVWDYFEQVQKEAKSKLKAKEQEARERSIQQAKLAAKKEKEAEVGDIQYLIYLLGLAFALALIVFILISFIDADLFSVTIFLRLFGCLLGAILPLVIMHLWYEVASIKGFLAYLLYIITTVIIIVAGFRYCKTDDELIPDKIQNQLTEKFGQEYNFSVEMPSGTKFGNDEVKYFIILTERETQDKDTCYLTVSSDENLELYGLYDPSFDDVRSEISDIVEDINTQKE